MTAPEQFFRRQDQAHRYIGGTSSTQIGLPAYGALSPEAFAFINATTGADRTVVPAVSGFRLKVLSYALYGPAGSVSTATLKGDSGAISPLISIPAGGIIKEVDNNGLFVTLIGESLLVATSATVGVRVTYILSV